LSSDVFSPCPTVPPVLFTSLVVTLSRLSSAWSFLSALPSVWLHVHSSVYIFPCQPLSSMLFEMQPHPILPCQLPPSQRDSPCSRPYTNTTVSSAFLIIGNKKNYFLEKADVSTLCASILPHCCSSSPCVSGIGR